MKQTARKGAPPRRPSRSFKLLCAVLAALLLFGAGYGIFAAIAGPRGFFLRRTTVMESTHFAVNGGMMAYYYYDLYHAALEKEGDALEAEGLDPTRPLAEQKRTDGKTWYDYFMTDALDYVRRILVFAEAAYRAGDGWSEAESEAEQGILALRELAASEGEKTEDYITAYYGSGVSEEDIREALKLSAYGYRRLEALAATTYPTEQLEAVLAESPSSFRRVDYIVYSVKAELPINPTESEMREAFLAAEATANRLANATSESGFVAEMETHLRAANSGIKTYEVAHRVSDAYVYEAAPSTADELSRWVSDARRVSGDTAIFGQNGDYRIAFFLTSHEKLTYHRVSMRHILFAYADYAMTQDAEAAALRIQSEFEADAPSEEKFVSLVMQFSADSATVQNGGLYANIGRGDLEKGLSDWLLDPTRTAGDTAVIGSIYGYHLVYFTARAETPVWQEEATLLLQERAYAEYLAAAHLRIYNSALGCLPSVVAVKNMGL